MDEIIAAILTILEGLEVKSSESFIGAVLNRLSSFGYEVTSADEWLIAFCIQKVQTHINNTCNTLSVPDGLFYVAVDRVCGEFLSSLKNTGKLVLEDLDLDGAITQIKEGDTTVNFATGTSQDELFTAFVKYLQTEGAGDEVCYRKLKW